MGWVSADSPPSGRWRKACHRDGTVYWWNVDTRAVQLRRPRGTQLAGAHVWQSLENAFVCNADRPCFGVLTPEGTWHWQSYCEVYAQIVVVAASLVQRLQLEPGAVVCLWGIDRPELVYLDWACARQGLTRLCRNSAARVRVSPQCAPIRELPANSWGFSPVCLAADSDTEIGQELLTVNAALVCVEFSLLARYIAGMVSTTRGDCPIAGTGSAGGSVSSAGAGTSDSSVAGTLSLPPSLRHVVVMDAASPAALTAMFEQMPARAGVVERGPAGEIVLVAGLRAVDVWHGRAGQTRGGVSSAD